MTINWTKVTCEERKREICRHHECVNHCVYKDCGYIPLMPMVDNDPPEKTPETPLYGSIEDRMFGRMQRAMTDQEQRDSAVFFDYMEKRYAEARAALERGFMMIDDHDAGDSDKEENK